MLMITAAAGLAAAILFSSMGYRRAGIVRITALGISFYISLYLAVSGILIYTERFTMQRTAALLIPVFAGAAAIRFLRKGRPAKIEPEGKQSIVLAIILVAAALVSWTNHAQLHNTGQDEGLYQMRALYYIGGHYDSTISFPEYRLNNGRWDQSNFRANFEDMNGFYQEEWDPDSGYPRGVLHGIPTFPALLALWGKIFGISAMQGVLVLCYLISVVNVWLICENLRFGKVCQAAGTVLYAASPIVLWNAENTLVEIVLAMLLSSFFVLLTERDGKNAFRTALPLIGVCFVHILVTMLMPMIVLLYALNWFYSRKRGYVSALIVVLLAYALGFTVMYGVAASYMDSNMFNLYARLKFIMNSDNAVPFIWGIAMFCILAALVTERLLRGKLLPQKRPGPKAERICRAAVILLLIGLAGYSLYFIRGEEWVEWIPQLMIVGIAAMTGYLLLPAALFGTVRESGRLLRDRQFASLALGVYYILIMLGVLLWTVVRSYYYFARYLTPYIFLVVVLAGYVLKKLPPAVTAGLTVLMIAAMILRGPLPYRAQDLTYADYDVVENMSACIGEKDAVLIYEQGYGIHRIYTLPVKALTGADVFFLNPDHPMQQAKMLRHSYDHLYVLQYYDLGADPLEGEDMIEIYRGEISGTFYEMDPEAGEKHLFFPTELADMSEVLQLRMFNFEERK